MGALNIDQYRRAARKQIENITSDESLLDLQNIVTLNDTSSPSLQDFVEALALDDASKDTLKSFECILVLQAFLAEVPTLVQNEQYHDTVASLRQWIASAILPTGIFAERSIYSIDQTPALNEKDITVLHALSSHGIRLLRFFEQITPLSNSENASPLYVFLASFTNLDDPWTSKPANKAAIAFLNDLLSPDDKPSLEIILTGLLQRLKPAFARSKNPAITQQARKAISPLPVGPGGSDELDPPSKPWKYHEVYTPTVLRWVLSKLPDVDNKFIESIWPLIIPPILTLIDDVSTTYKAAGCTNLTLFLQANPSAMLHRTGLGEVFENAIMPCLMHLPSLTEEAESIQLLSAAYPALFRLARVRFPEDKDHRARIKALDRIMRQGILKGYLHAGENVRIADLLVKQMIVVVDEMGIDIVKYLKTILPLLSANLTNPFATSFPPLLQTSIRATQTIILTAWPRIAYHRGTILNGLTACWCRIDEEERKSDELEEVKKQIGVATRLLTKVLVRECDVSEEYGMLIEADGRLEGLLRV